jgi:hypothetical protein
MSFDNEGLIDVEFRVCKPEIEATVGDPKMFWAVSL